METKYNLRNNCASDRHSSRMPESHQIQSHTHLHRYNFPMRAIRSCRYTYEFGYRSFRNSDWLMCLVNSYLGRYRYPTRAIRMSLYRFGFGFRSFRKPGWLRHLVYSYLDPSTYPTRAIRRKQSMFVFAFHNHHKPGSQVHPPCTNLHQNSY